MELPPRLGVVCCVLQLLLLTACGDVHHSSPATDHRLPPAADHRPPPDNHRPSPKADHRPPPAADHRLPPAINHRPPPAADHRPPPAADNRLPPAADHRPPPAADHRPPPAADHRPPPAADHRPPPAADHRLPPSNARPDAVAANRTSHQDYLVRDCSDLPNGSPSGIYEIKPDMLNPTNVYCDTNDDVYWTVFQRRGEFLPQKDFQQDWEEYKWGFGLLTEEFWWGLHHLWQLTSQLDRVYELRVDLWDWEYQTAYATYQNFTIGSEGDGYRLNFTDYAGNAGDALDFHNGMKFSTFDRDNDEDTRNCAVTYTGAWWYNGCYYSNLNGLYLPGSTDTGTVNWFHWKNSYFSFNATTMKIRPTKKL